MEFDLLSGRAAFDTLETDWRDLVSRMAAPTYDQSIDHARHAWRFAEANPDRHLRILVGRPESRAEGGAVLIWPFSVHLRSGLRQATWLGVYFGYRDLIVEPGANSPQRIEAGWAAVLRELDVDLIWCPAIRENTEAFDLLSAQHGLFIRRDPTLRASLTGGWQDWEAFRQGRHSEFRREQDRRLRRLQERGVVDFRQLDQPAAIQQTLGWIFEQRKTWAKQAGVATDYSPAYARYFYDVCMDELACGNLLFGTLTLDEKLIAAEFSFVRGTCLEMQLAAYDPDRRRYGPGLLLFERMLEWAFERKLAVADFRLGAEPYKRHFSSGSSTVYSYLVPCSLKGKAYVLWRRSGAREMLHGGSRWLRNRS